MTVVDLPKLDNLALDAAHAAQYVLALRSAHRSVCVNTNQTTEIGPLSLLLTLRVPRMLNPFLTLRGLGAEVVQKTEGNGLLTAPATEPCLPVTTLGPATQQGTGHANALPCNKEVDTHSSAREDTEHIHRTLVRTPT